MLSAGGTDENGTNGSCCPILCRNGRSRPRHLQGPSGGEEPPWRSVDQFCEKVLQRSSRCSKAARCSEDELHQEMLVGRHWRVKPHLRSSRSTGAATRLAWPWRGHGKCEARD